MRLGAAFTPPIEDPQDLARFYLRQGYSAAVCPGVSLADKEKIRAIRQAFSRQDILIAEVGVWNNMLDADPLKRAANLQANIEKMALAEEIGAACCVNIAGSFNPDSWHGPHPRDLSEEAFELTVQNVRTILDTVKPRHAFYTLESMPWMFPDSPDSYLRLLQAVDRPMFGVHLDPVNMISSPQRFFNNSGFLRECFQKLGPWMVSIHAKDIRLETQLTVHLNEARPGLGSLDYAVLLHELSRLPVDTPLIIEHLPDEEYPPAQEHILDVAKAENLSFHKPQPR